MTIIVAIFSSFALLVLVPSPVAEARYSNSQAQSQAIDCQAGDSGGAPNCANIGPLTQADGTASSPINLQITGNGEQEQDPPSPPEDTHQTIVTLHDDAGGHAAGWNPGVPIPITPLQIIPGPNPPFPPTTPIVTIKSPVELAPSFSIEATFVNPPNRFRIFGESAGECELVDVDTSRNTFDLDCTRSDGSGSRPHDGAILTYIITK